MSEITPNTPNPVREDAYVEELAAKLGIDPQYIPKSPVWRNEEEIKAIAELFANMSGGSSGGGVLVVHATASDELYRGSAPSVVNALTLDKTWQEIYDADAVSIVWVDEDDAKIHMNCSQVAASPQLGGGGIVYHVFAASGGEGYNFETSSASGYPSYTFE